MALTGKRSVEVIHLPGTEGNTPHAAWCCSPQGNQDFQVWDQVVTAAPETLNLLFVLSVTVGVLPFLTQGGVLVIGRAPLGGDGQIYRLILVSLFREWVSIE